MTEVYSNPVLRLDNAKTALEIQIRVKPVNYPALIEKIKDYRVAWVQLQVYIGNADRDIAEDEHLLQRADLYDERDTHLTESAITSLIRHLGFTRLFLERARSMRDI